jgi:RNA polymerase sigma-70 factor (ECF subfamily)
VEDLSQEVFLTLFSRDAHVLRSWQAERGSSLESFVGLVAERQVLSFLRGGGAEMSGNASQARNPWMDGHE